VTASTTAPSVKKPLHRFSMKITVFVVGQDALIEANRAGARSPVLAVARAAIDVCIVGIFGGASDEIGAAWIDELGADHLDARGNVERHVGGVPEVATRVARGRLENPGDHVADLIAVAHGGNACRIEEDAQRPGADVVGTSRRGGQHQHRQGCDEAESPDDPQRSRRTGGGTSEES